MRRFKQKLPLFSNLLFSYAFTVGLLTYLIVYSFTKQTRLDYIIVGASIPIFGIIFFTRNLWVNLKAPLTIEIDNRILKLVFYLDKTRLVQTERIFAIEKVFAYTAALRICYDVFGKPKSFLVHTDRLQDTADKFAFGQFIEQILLNSPNIRHIEIDKLTVVQLFGQPAWAKEPDWTIINTAKRRAEENRKKHELTPDPSLTKRGEQDNLPSPSGRGVGGEGKDNT
ncbi:MAG: hypothetical protein ACOY5B_08470 [Spirochaetota bacterium]